MGIVRKQAIANSIFSYTGVVLGYVNLILLFPAFFTSEQFGLFQLLISVSSVYSQLAPLGLVNTINRFFPFFKTDDKRHNAFLSYITLIAVSGMLLVTLIYILFKRPIINAYVENSASFIEYFYTVIPFGIFLVLFMIFEALNRSVYNTRFSTFLREVAVRLVAVIGILLYIFKALDFSQFIYFYVFGNGILAALLFLQFLFSGEYKFYFSFTEIKFSKLKEVMQYGFYTLLSGAAMFIGQKVDVLMIGSLVGLSIVGAYSLYFYVASVIYVPMRAMSKISYPIIASAWKDNDLKQIQDIYKRTSLIQLIFGCLIYIGVIVNKHNLFYFIKKPEYIDNFPIFYFVGLAVLIDISVGLNSEIISSSPKFRYDTLFNIILLLVSVTANIIFIPLFGGKGAAIAAMCSFFTFNFIKWLFIYKNFNMQPIGIKQILIIIIAALSYFTGIFIPQINNVYIDIILRSSAVTILYSVLIYVFKISTDLNERLSVYLSLITNFKK